MQIFFRDGCRQLWQLCNLLFFGGDFALDFLYVFGSRKVLGTDASRSKHLTDCAVVLDVLGGDGDFALEVFLVNVVVEYNFVLTTRTIFY